MKGINKVNVKVSRIVTSATEKPQTPNFEFKNARNKDITIFSIGLVPSGVFKTQGFLSIDYNGHDTLIDLEAGDFTNITDAILKIDPFGINFLRNEKIRFFVWNPSGNEVNLTVSITIGEKD